MTSLSAIYLDHNATSPPSVAVRDAIRAALDEGLGNPSSPHLAGRHARALLAEARDSVAGLAGCDPDRLIFTSGATESCNRVIERAGRAGKGAPTVVVSAVEHAAVLAPADLAARAGRRTFQVGVDTNGLIDLTSLEDVVSDGNVLVSLQWVNNEIGVIQPIEVVARLCRAHGALLHVDASQALGKVPMDLDALDADFVSLSGHKIGAPAGTGALYVRDRRTLPAFQVGGEQERGRRAGTENLLGIVGFGAAAKERQQRFSSIIERWTSLQAGFESALPAMCRVNGVGAPRVTNTVSVVFPGLDATVLLARLDIRGVFASQGSACHSARPEPSHVLRAIGLGEADAYSTIRFSFGGETTVDEVHGAIAVLRDELQQFEARGSAVA